MRILIFFFMLFLELPLKSQVDRCSQILLIKFGFKPNDTIIISSNRNNYIIKQHIDSFKLTQCGVLGFCYFIQLPKGRQNVIVKYKEQKCSVKLRTCNKEVHVSLMNGKLIVQKRRKEPGYL